MNPTPGRDWFFSGLGFPRFFRSSVFLPCRVLASEFCTDLVNVDPPSIVSTKSYNWIELNLPLVNYQNKGGLAAKKPKPKTSVQQGWQLCSVHYSMQKASIHIYCVTSLFLKCTIYCFHLITNDLFTYRLSHIYCPIRLNGFRQGLWSISITCNWRFCMLILLSRLPLKFEIRNLWTLSSQSLARSRPANYLTTTTTMTSLSRRKTSKVFLCFLWPGLFLCWLHFDLSLPTLIQFCCHPGLVAPKFCYDYNFHLRWNSNVSPWVLP